MPSMFSPVLAEASKKKRLCSAANALASYHEKMSIILWIDVCLVGDLPVFLQIEFVPYQDN